MRCSLVSALAVSILSSPASAASPPSQAELLELLRQQAERISVLERRLEELATRSGENDASFESRAGDQQAAAAPTAQSVTSVPASPPPIAAPVPKLSVSGDARFRYEANFSDPVRDQHRFALRARIGATYAATDRLTLGARLTTGSSGDPNSSDVTLSSFGDDFEISLDRAYLAYDAGDLTLLGGRFAMPLLVEDTLWDGDVNPQGLAAVYEKARVSGVRLRVSGLYYLIEESAAGAESTLSAGQLAVEKALLPDLSLKVSGAYYDYRLPAFSTADPGDYRTNARAPDGGYLSDFNLLHALGQITYAGLGKHWPVSLSGTYVYNAGARVGGNDAFSGTIALGTIADARLLRFAYHYADVEQDAVFAAFAQDNIPLGSDYYLHELVADYNLGSGVFLNASLYHYRPRGAAAQTLGTSWRDRFRTSVTVVF